MTIELKIAELELAVRAAQEEIRALRDELRQLRSSLIVIGRGLEYRCDLLEKARERETRRAEEKNAALARNLGVID